MSKYLDTDQAAAYLGFKTRAGIRHCVYRGELKPDGRGYRNGYVFLPETLDRWVKARQEKLDGGVLGDGQAGDFCPAFSVTIDRGAKGFV